MGIGSLCIGEGEGSTIGELYERDLWVRQFIQAVCDSYGVPASILECDTSADSKLLVWSMLHLAEAFILYPEWLEVRKCADRADPVKTAEVFIRAFHEKEGRDVIPIRE